MKTMICSDFLTMRTSLLQTLGICCAVSVILAFAMDGTLAITAMITCMGALLYMMSVMAIDEQGGWEKFRLTLPLTRSGVVYGRYASVAIAAVLFALLGLVLGLVLAAVFGSVAGVSDAVALPDSQTAFVACVVCSLCIVLVLEALMLPILFRFGVNLATRLVPLAYVVALLICFQFVDMATLGAWFDSIEAWLNADLFMNGVLLLGVAVIVSLALYAVSALIAAKLYMKRSL